MIGVLGANGFVGDAICNQLKKEKIAFTKITRQNHKKFIKKKFNILINSSMPSKRFWAKKNPLQDFNETVEKTKFFCSNYNYKKFIQISTVSARCQKNTVYGKNKKISENYVKKLKNFTILRLGPMFGNKLTKGVLIDMINSKTVFVSKKSKYSFTNVNEIAKWICKNLKKNKNKIIEIGASDYLTLEEISKKIGSHSKFCGLTDNQIILNKSDFFSPSSSVYKFLKKSKKF